MYCVRYIRGLYVKSGGDISGLFGGGGGFFCRIYNFSSASKLAIEYVKANQIAP